MSVRTIVAKLHDSGTLPYKGCPAANAFDSLQSHQQGRQVAKATTRSTATTYSFPVTSCYLLIAFIIEFGCL